MSVTWNPQAIRGELRVSFLTREASNILAILLLPLLCAIGLLGNLLVCMAIWFDRQLHNVTNYFLFSLAFADLLVCGLVMPLSLIVEVRHGVWTWSFSMCLLYVYADVFLCSASIVHMSVISLDRYLGISKPLKARNKSKTMITAKIIFVWIVTVLISCPIAIAALLDPSNILNDDVCMIANRYYMIYGSTFAFLIPFLIMAVTYVRTTSLLKQQTIIYSSHHNNAQPKTLILRRTCTQRLRRTCTQRNQNLANFQNGILYGGDTKVNNSSVKATLLPIYSEGELELLSDATEQNALEKSRLRSLRERTATAIFALAAKVSKKETFPRSSTELANEHKATRVLAVVFACFFVCWTPFFVANFAVGFCGEPCAVPPAVASFFLWLGYFSSTINPLIYTIFNRRFRQAFLRILRCQCTHSVRSTYANSYYSRRMDIDGCTTIDRSYSPREVDFWSSVSWKKSPEGPKHRRQEFPALSALANSSHTATVSIVGGFDEKLSARPDCGHLRNERKLTLPFMKRSQTGSSNLILLSTFLKKSLSTSDLTLLASSPPLTRIVLLDSDLFKNPLKETFL